MRSSKRSSCILLLLASILGACGTGDPVRPHTRADAHGDPSAVHAKCYGLLYGVNGEQKNPAAALPWCEEGARLGAPSSITLLAEMNHLGLATPVDMPRARMLYERAAALGHEHGQFMAGYMCWRGDGGPVDKERAKRYLRSAADKGNAQARKLIPALESDGAAPPPKGS